MSILRDNNVTGNLIIKKITMSLGRSGATTHGTLLKIAVVLNVCSFKFQSLSIRNTEIQSRTKVIIVGTVIKLVGLLVIFRIKLI